MRINRHDTNGTKPLLGKGELGYDDYAAGGDTGRVYVGTGSSNVMLAKKTEVVDVDGKVDTHIDRTDNPHSVTKAQVGLGNVDNTTDADKNVLSATKWTTARMISLTGDVTGSTSIDGSGNVTLVATVANDSHTHAFTNLTNKPTTLQGYGINPEELPASINLDTKIITGLYSQSSNSETSLELNYPVALAGLLEVFAYSIIIHQRYWVYNSNDVYYRAKYSTGAWTPWTKGANVDDTVAAATKLQTARTINGVSFDGTANIVAPTNLTIGTITTTAVPIESSSGTNASIPAATTTLAGVMTAADKAKLDGIEAGAASAVPVSTVITLADDVVPTGFLECNGATISRTAYANLFAVIGTTFGAGNGTTTFNLPDLRGEFIRGWDNSRGVDTSRTLGSSQAGAYESHSHEASMSSSGAHTHTVGGRHYGTSALFGNGNSASATVNATTPSGGDHTHTVTINASGSTETRPRNIAMMYCIKY